MQTEEIERINEKGSLKIRKIQIRQRVPHEEDNGSIINHHPLLESPCPTTERLLSILAHSTRLICFIFTIIFNKKYNYEFIIFMLLLILLIKNEISHAKVMKNCLTYR